MLKPSTISLSPFSHDPAPHGGLDHIDVLARAPGDELWHAGATVVHSPTRHERTVQLEEIALPGRVSPPHHLLRHIVPAELNATTNTSYGELRTSQPKKDQVDGIALVETSPQPRCE